MRRSVQPNRPSARTSCRFSSPKMLVMLAEEPQSPRRVNVLGCPYLTGRFSGVDDWPVLGVDRGSVGLSISPAMAATIFRRDLKLTVVRVGGKQNCVVGLTPAAIARLWAQIR